MNQPELILASSSPRRQALLAGLGLAFRVEAADVDETASPGETPEQLVQRLSRSKAAAVAARHGNSVVLAADTVVVLEGHILGKPAGWAEAADMLAALGGRVHHVYTAVSTAARGRLATDLCRSEVWMRSYSAAEISDYVATGDPLDKAGAYAIQHPVFSPVERWHGCYTGIMGLPVGLAARLLLAAGIRIEPGVALAACEAASGQGNCCLQGLPGQC